MARKKKLENETGEEVTPTQEEDTFNQVALNDVALSIAKDPLTGEWVLLEIPYDFGTLQIGKPKELTREVSRAIINERIKISVSDKFLRGK